MSEFNHALDESATQFQSREIARSIEHLPYTIDGRSAVVEVAEMPTALAELFHDIYIVGRDYDAHTSKHVDIFYTKEAADEMLASKEEAEDTHPTFCIHTGEESPATSASYSVFWEQIEEDIMDEKTPLRQVGDLQIIQNLTQAKAQVTITRSLCFGVWVARNGNFFINRDVDGVDTVNPSDEAKSKIRIIQEGLKMAPLMDQALEELELFANGIVVLDDNTPMDLIQQTPNPDHDYSQNAQDDFDDEDYELRAEAYIDEELAETILEQLEMLEDRRNGIGLVTQKQADGLIKVLSRLLEN